MKMRCMAPALALGLLVGAVGAQADTDAARFLGGNYDGWAQRVMNAPSGFQGIGPDHRFHGGSYDGWNRLAMAEPAGFKAPHPDARFFGGAYDGWARSVMGEEFSAITIVKTVGYVDDHGASTTQIEAIETSTVHYFFVVANAGNVTLTNVTFSDPHLSLEDVSLPDLDPGQSATNSASWVVDASVTNTATAAAINPRGDPVSDDAEAVVLMVDANPLIALAKTVSHAGAGFAASEPEIEAVDGMDVTFWLVVSNPGNLILTNVNLSDPHLALDDEPLADLLPGQSVTSSVPWNVSASVTNTATATAVASNAAAVDDTDAAVVLMLTAAPEIAVVKTVSVSGDYADSVKQIAASVDDTVTFWFVVSNPGNVTLTNVLLNDPDLSLIDAPLADLLPGQSVTSSAPWMVNGDLVNTVTASGVAVSLAVPTVDDTDSAEVQTAPIITLSSGTDQSFTWTPLADPASVALAMVTITATEPRWELKIDDELSLLAPSGSDYRFDKTAAVSLDGSAKNKVGAAAYSGDGRGLIIPVTADFLDGDTLTISGLKLTDLHLARSIPERLELDFSGDATADTLDEYTVLISIRWTGGFHDGWDSEAMSDWKFIRHPTGTLIRIQ